jgi:hypothetical protein
MMWIAFAFSSMMQLLSTGETFVLAVQEMDLLVPQEQPELPERQAPQARQERMA